MDSLLSLVVDIDCIDEIEHHLEVYKKLALFHSHEHIAHGYFKNKLRTIFYWKRKILL